MYYKLIDDRLKVVQEVGSLFVTEHLKTSTLGTNVKSRHISLRVTIKFHHLCPSVLRKMDVNKRNTKSSSGHKQVTHFMLLNHLQLRLAPSSL